MNGLSRIRHALSDTLYRYGWDTRCRNLYPARLLQGLLAENGAMSHHGPTLLDVGSGHPGLAAFLPNTRIVGLDARAPAEQDFPLPFIISDATALPFHDRAFPFVTCIDVLEHLMPETRIRAIKEMVRVASRCLLIAFPHSPQARECDLAFREACRRRARPVPGWLEEHLSHEYPTEEMTVAQVNAAAATMGRSATVTRRYCEPLPVCKFVRAAATRSTWLYVGANLACGLLLPTIAVRSAAHGYRTILIAELSR